MELNETLLAAAVALVALSGCRKEETPVGEARPAAETTQAPAAREPAHTEAVAPAVEEAVPFDVATIPVSDKPVGDWPYLAAPEGYELRSERTLDLSRVPFWTGQALEFVEGKVYEARVGAAGDKTYSRFEVLKRIDEALAALGAVKVAAGKIPRQVLDDELPEDFGVEFNTGSGGYYPGQELSTYVLRHADKATWFKVSSNTNSASLLVAEADVPASTPAQ